jgi:sugar phosphate isomerase/epimerase
MDISRFAMDTASIPGSLDEKLNALTEAGFSRVSLWAKDLVDERAGGLNAAVARVKRSGLTICSFEVLRDFEGLSGQFLDYKLEIAKSMMKMMHQVGADLLLVSSSTTPQATGDIELIARHLQLLATLATPLGIRIGYEALSWGRCVSDYRTAWQAVQLADRANFGLVLDSYHLMALGTPLEPLDAIPMDKVFLVQLADAMWDQMTPLDDLIENSRHHRFFPGEGEHSVAVTELVERLEGAGYRGPYAFEVVNDDYLQCPPNLVASRARKAADWLAARLEHASN